MINLGGNSMKVYTFGDRKNPVILLLPGTCCHWKNSFEKVIPLLTQDFYVACISYDGFDETEDTVFPGMLEETAKIESYISENFDGKVECAYGCSLGGSFVGLLIQRKNIHINHGILGSSDLDQMPRLPAYIFCKIGAAMFYKMFQKGKLPGFMQKRIEQAKTDPYIREMLDMFGINRCDLTYIKKESIFRQTYTDYITPLENQIQAPGTKVHIFYATKMGEKYLKRYQNHFANPDIRYHNLQHEELLVCEPQKWVDEVKKCCNKDIR
jgi:hypothetical protein